MLITIKLIILDNVHTTVYFTYIYSTVHNAAPYASIIIVQVHFRKDIALGDGVWQYVIVSGSNNILSNDILY